MTEARLYAEHQQIKNMNFNTVDYGEKLKILRQAKQRQHFIEMSTYNRLTDAKKEIDAIGDILRPWL